MAFGNWDFTCQCGHTFTNLSEVAITIVQLLHKPKVSQSQIQKGCNEVQHRQTWNFSSIYLPSLSEILSSKVLTFRCLKPAAATLHTGTYAVNGNGLCVNTLWPVTHVTHPKLWPIWPTDSWPIDPLPALLLCRFVVLRTTILVTEKEAEKMTDMLYTILSHRIVTMVLKQQSVLSLSTINRPVQHHG